MAGRRHIFSYRSMILSTLTLLLALSLTTCAVSESLTPYNPADASRFNSDDGAIQAQVARRDASFPWPSREDANSNMHEDASLQDAAYIGTEPPYPIVFIHGFAGFNRLGPLEYFFRVLDTLQEEGETLVFAPAIPAYNGIPERAAYLATQIDRILQETGAAKVHIIAHSQGGIDSRHLISTLGYANRIASLTTVASPHRGTPLADYVLHLPENSLDPVARGIAWMMGLVEDPDASANSEADAQTRQDMDASLRSLSTDFMHEYNANHPDDPSVPIFSFAGVSNLQKADDICSASDWGRIHRVDIVDPLLVANAAILSGWNPFNRKPNDGVVPTASMPWGKFVGCVPADHFDEVGQIADFLPNLISGFNHVDFYRKRVAFLRDWEQGS